MARPTKYNKTFAEQARKLCLLGYTDAELADFFGVHEDTINEWKKRHKEFSVSVKAGKDAADAEVVDRLYQRARGFEHESEEIKVVAGEVVRVPIRKIYPPDTAAAMIWLKNRQKNKWRDRQEITGEDGAPVSQLVIVRPQQNSSQTANNDATVSPNGEITHRDTKKPQ